MCLQKITFLKYYFKGSATVETYRKTWKLGLFDSAKKLQSRRSSVREEKIKRRGRRNLLQEIMEGNSGLLTLFSYWRYNYLSSEKRG